MRGCEACGQRLPGPLSLPCPACPSEHFILWSPKEPGDASCSKGLWEQAGFPSRRSRGSQAIGSLTASICTAVAWGWQACLPALIK